MKLSPTQVMVLKAMAKPGVEAFYMPYLGSFRRTAYWDVVGFRVRAETLNKLISLEMAKPKLDSRGYYDTATITPAGREYLERLEVPDA